MKQKHPRKKWLVNNSWINFLGVFLFMGSGFYLGLYKASLNAGHGDTYLIFLAIAVFWCGFQCIFLKWYK